MQATPLFIFDLVAGLGLGEQATVAAVLVFVTLYLHRGKKAAGSAVSVIGSLWLLTVGALSALAVAVFFGWVIPDPAAFIADATSALAEFLDLLFGPVVDFVTGLL